MIFLADHMLGSLARWLRFFGFDTAYPEVLPDKMLIAIAKREGRTILTRDKELAKTKEIETLYIESVELEKQLTQVFETYNLKIDSAFSRCSLCNSILKPVKKSDVKEKVPEKVFLRQNEFWMCKECKKYYWQGTHYLGIKAKIKELEGKTATT
jgi:uncharacterized protein with PIN domain